MTKSACCCRNHPVFLKVDGSTGDPIWVKGYTTSYDPSETPSSNACYRELCSVVYDPVADQIWAVASDNATTIVKLFAIHPGSGLINFRIVDKCFSVGSTPGNGLGGSFLACHPFQLIGSGNINVLAGDLGTGSNPKVLTYDSTGTLIASSPTLPSGRSPINSSGVGLNLWMYSSGWTTDFYSAGGFARSYTSAGASLGTFPVGPFEFIVSSALTSDKIVFSAGETYNPGTRTISGAVVGGGAGPGGSSKNAFPAGDGCVALNEKVSPSTTQCVNLDTGSSITIGSYWANPNPSSNNFVRYFMAGTEVFVARGTWNTSKTGVIEKYDSAGSLVWSVAMPRTFTRAPNCMTVDGNGDLFIC